MKKEIKKKKQIIAPDNISDIDLFLDVKKNVIEEDNDEIIYPYNKVKARSNWILFLLLKKLLDLRIERNNFKNPIELDFKDIFNKTLSGYHSYQDIWHYVEDIQNDIDFYKKHNMEAYKLDVGDETPYDIYFTDFTQDFLEKYLDFRFGPKDVGSGEKNNGVTINKIEVLENENEEKTPPITLFINGDYSKPLEFNRSKAFMSIYDIAKDGYIQYDRTVFDYFNSNKQNPLYKTYGFSCSKIFKEVDGDIKPNIPIILRKQKYIGQQKNKK